MPEPTLSYRITKPLSPTAKAWRGLLRTGVLFSLIYATCHVLIACNAWMLGHGSRMSYYRTPWSDLGVFGTLFYAFLSAVPTIQFTFAVILIVAGIGVMALRIEFRQLLLVALAGLVSMGLVLAAVQCVALLSQTNVMRFPGRSKMGDLINPLVYTSGIIAQQLLPVLPGVLAFEFVRRVPASPADEVFLQRPATTPRALGTVGAISIVIGLVGLVTRPIALFSLDPSLGFGLTPAWVAAPTPGDLSLVLWQFGSRFVLFACCALMVVGGVGAVCAKPWSIRYLARQTVPAITVNLVDVCLTGVLIYQLTTARATAGPIMSTLTLQCLSIAADFALRAYCGSRAVRTWVERGNEVPVKDAEPTPVLRMNPGFDQQ